MQPALTLLESVMDKLLESHTSHYTNELKQTRQIRMLQNRLHDTTEVDYETERRVSKLQFEMERMRQDHYQQKLKWTHELEDLHLTINHAG